MLYFDFFAAERLYALSEFECIASEKTGDCGEPPCNQWRAFLCEQPVLWREDVWARRVSRALCTHKKCWTSKMNENKMSLARPLASHSGCLSYTERRWPSVGLHRLLKKWTSRTLALGFYLGWLQEEIYLWGHNRGVQLNLGLKDIQTRPFILVCSASRSLKIENDRSTIKCWHRQVNTFSNVLICMNSNRYFHQHVMHVPFYNNLFQSFKKFCWYNDCFRCLKAIKRSKLKLFYEIWCWRKSSSTHSVQTIVNFLNFMSKT